jgi:hypothetical protein
MTGGPLHYVLLFVCWLSALVTLIVFLESWFALTRRSRLATIRSTRTQGVVSVLVPLARADEAGRRCLQSILDQSYPFMELLILHDVNEQGCIDLAEELSALHSHVPVRPIPVPFSITDDTARIRALEHAQSSVRGSWILVLESDLILNPQAVESALEFSESEEIVAVALFPGVECRSLWQKLLAPSLEWFARMISVVDRGREKSDRLGDVSAPFLLVHGQTHAVVSKMNRLPGVLNESGWSASSFRVEGLKTFQGDGSGWIAREATTRSLMSRLEAGSNSRGRVVGFVFSSLVISVVSVAGIVFGLLAGQEGFTGPGILYFSAFSYGLMATSYFFYSRQLGAATWFAPFWFLSHSMALLLTLLELRQTLPEPPKTRSPIRHELRRKVPTRRD